MNEEGFELVKNSLSRNRRTATPIGQVVPTQKEIDELFDERITPETDLPPMQPLFEMFEVPCFYRGELVADCGKAKSGKTFFLSILMAGCLTQKALALRRFCHTERTEITEMIPSQAKRLTLTDHTDHADNNCHTALELCSLATGWTQERTEMKPLRVLWIDTEQSQQSTQEILKDRIIPLAEKGLADSAEIFRSLTDDTDCTDGSLLWRELGHTENTETTERASQAKEVSPTEMTEITEMPPSEDGSVESVLSVRDLDETFYAFNLRGLGYDRRQKMVEVAVRAIKPDIVILDGIKDLMTDINDAVQATIIMEKLMALAKEQNCCIVCVLHQNKSEQDRNMRGSIGTELTNKAFEVFQCEVISENNGKTDTFKVTHTFSRKKKMKQNFYYCINDEGLPEWLPDYQEQPRDGLGRWVSPRTVSGDHEALVNEADLRKLFTNAMEGHTQRPFNEVMAIALKKCGIIDAKAYYRSLDQAVAQGIVRKEVHPETGRTWLVLDDGTLPF